MPKVIPFSKSISPGEFEREVRGRAAMSHMVILTDHIREQMAERDITFRQVLNTLRKGTLKKGPTRNAAKAANEGTMAYHGTGREITVVCALNGRDLTVIAITAY